MNEFNNLENIIKDKVNSFEYPYDKNAWVSFKKNLPGKSYFWNYFFAVIVVVIVTSVIIYLNTDKIITNCSTNKPIKNLAEINNNKENNIIVNNNQKTNIKSNYSETTHNSANITNSETINNKITINTAENIVSKENVQYTPNAMFTCSSYEGCSPLIVKFNPQEISDSLIYSWDFGDGTISTDKTPSHIYTKTGNFSVTLLLKHYKSENIITNKKQDIISVLDVPIADFSYQINGYNVIVNNQSVNYIKCKWLLPNSESTEDNPTFDINKNGKYSLNLIVTNKNGCIDSIKKDIEFKVAHPIWIATAFKPLTDGENNKIGPQVLNYEDYYFEFEIYNTNEQLVYKSKGNNVSWNGRNTINSELCESGFYFYKLISIDKYGNSQELKGKFKLLK